VKIFTCEEARTALGEFLSGDLGMSPGRSLDAHLAGCPPCTSHAERLFWQERTISELAAASRAEEMILRIRGSIAGMEPKEVTDRMAAVRALPRSRRSLWVAAAAALVAVAAAAWVLRPEETPEPTLVLPAPKEDGLRPVPVSPKRDSAAVQERNQDHDGPRLPEPERVPAVAVEKRHDRAPETVVPRPPEHAPKIDVEQVPDRAAPARTPPRPDVVAPAPVIDVLRRTPEDAVAWGLRYLRARLDVKGAKAAARETRTDELVLWTLLAASVPAADPDCRELLAGILDRKLERTYQVALQAMLLEEIDRVKYQGRIAQCAQFLVDNQCRNGQWSYGEPSIFVEEIKVPPAPKTTATGSGKSGIVDFSQKSKPAAVRKVQIKRCREGPASGDNSNSMYAALGLRACHDANVVLPRDQVELAAGWWREAQIGKNPYAGDGWCYGGKNHCRKGYGSMTAGAVGSLIICDYVLGRDWTRNPVVKSGLDWMAKNFSVSENPGPPEHGGGRPGYMLYYYLYGLERAAILYGTERVGAHDWYEEGKKYLLENQNARGSWACPDGGNDVWDTCFAILFLRRAIPPLPPPVQTGK
jgi:hypothetical protein